jgi:N-acetylmuramic acid 6-phosphate etherase
MANSKKINTETELVTERQNPNSRRLDQLSIRKILEIINSEDQKITPAVRRVIPEIEKTIQLCTDCLYNEHRIFYVGAGTSGRLGILDAAELPPTFSAPPDWFTGIIAGGKSAVYHSIEGAEDRSENAQMDLQKMGYKPGDLVVGIASSGKTPYVTKALITAKELGSKTVFITFNPEQKNDYTADIVIAVNVGPEIVTGSTRMKAGTATKLILNMISTATMIKLGKVYGNLMVDLMVVNKKLLERGIRIIKQLTGLDTNKAEELLVKSGNSVKTAVVMEVKKCDRKSAIEIIKQAKGNLRSIIGDLD